VLRRAERIAREHGHDFIGTEHLVLGLLAEPDGIASQVLMKLGVAEQAAADVEAVLRPTGTRAAREYGTADRRALTGIRYRSGLRGRLSTT
jgi:ATP-dependent Clp protease ATP-binding subunit ClpA